MSLSPPSTSNLEGDPTMKPVLKKFRVTYKRGLKSPIICEAADANAAAVEALIKYRYNYGFVDNVHTWGVDKIVESVEEID